MPPLFNYHRKCLWQERQSGSTRGFTLIEMVVVIVLLGILAAVAIPRMLKTSDYDTLGFHDETLSLLRYAQKAAIAQRRTVCVAFPDHSTVNLTIAGVAQATICETPLVGPNKNCDTGLKQPTACVTAKSGVNYLTVPPSFNFDALGEPVSAEGIAVASQEIQVNGRISKITVEARTGYVHD